MADVYGRLTGKPGVVLGQGVFIGSSGGFGIMEAFMSGSSMIALTDTSEGGVFAQHGAYQGGSGEHGAVDLPGSSKPSPNTPPTLPLPRKRYRVCSITRQRSSW